MTTIDRIQPEFVEEIPHELEPGKLYISMTYATALHLCCCGCGSEVVTPLHPKQWKLSYDGEAVTLHPSIGSWSLPCRSHYFITANEVRWAPTWSDDTIAVARARDQTDLERHFEEESASSRRARVPRFMARLWRRLKRG
jgi:hypothetical protein